MSSEATDGSQSAVDPENMHLLESGSSNKKPNQYLTIEEQEEGTNLIHDEDDNDEFNSGERDQNFTEVLFSKPTVVSIGLFVGIIGLVNIANASHVSLLMSRACDDNMVDGQCDRVAAQLLVSDYEKYSLVVLQSVSILGFSIAGKLSDTYGRKLTLFLTVLSFSLGFVIYYFTIRSFHTFKFKIFLFSDAIKSLLGGSNGILGLVNSYVSDITSAKTRQPSMAFAFSMLFLGSLCGPFLGIFILKLGKKAGLDPDASDYLPLTAAIIVLSLTLTYIGFLLPESLPSAKSKSQITNTRSDRTSNESSKLAIVFNLVKSTVLGLVKEIKLLFLPTEYIPDHLKPYTKSLRFQVIFLVICNGIRNINTNALLMNYGIFKFKWDSSDVSFVFMFSSLVGLVTLSVVYPFLTTYLLPKVLKLKFKKDILDSIDYTLLAFGLGSSFLFNTFIAVAHNTGAVLSALVLCCLSNTLDPCITASTTKFYPANKTSQMLMSMNMICSIIAIVSPSIYLTLYKFGLSHGFPGAPFVGFACCYFVLFSLVIGARIFCVK